MPDQRSRPERSDADESALSDEERAELRERIEERREDAEFRARIERTLAEEREVLDALDD